MKRAAFWSGLLLINHIHQTFRYPLGAADDANFNLKGLREHAQCESKKLTAGLKSSLYNLKINLNVFL